MADNLRAPIFATRIWARDPAGVAVRAQGDVWQNQLTTNLAGQDQFFGAGGPNYDYPNPRGYIPAIILKTWIQQRPFYYSPSIPIPQSYDRPNPRGPLYSIDLRTWIHQGNIQLGRVIGIPTLAFTSDKQAITCAASDSPSGQNWSGAGYMARYEIDTPIQIEGIFLDALNNVYVDPTDVKLFVKDPAGATILYSIANSSVIRESAGHYTVTLEPTISGTWTYKWQSTGTFPATSPDTTFTVNASELIPG